VVQDDTIVYVILSKAKNPKNHEIAVNQLVAMGYVHVYDLGGIIDLSVDVFTFIS